MNNPIKYIKEKRLDEIKGNSFLAERLISSHGDKDNSNRAVMLCSHFQQAPVLANINPETKEYNGEFPLVFSRFENQIGKYSSGYVESDSDYKVLGKFVRNKYNYFLFVYNYKTKEYDALERNECYHITEKYGYKNENYMDEVEKGDKIQEEAILSANTSYDEYMNLCYGRNVRAVYYSFDDKTHEDAIIISESAAKKFSYYSVKTPRININTNDILLKLYDHGKCFPDIGEDVNENQILLCRRRNEYDTMLTNLRDLTTYKQGDTPYYCKGKVIDIKIYCNNDVDKLRTLPYYKQIVKYIDMQTKYNERVVECLEDIVEKNPEKCSDRLIAIYNDCKMKLDEGNYYEFENNKFDNVVIEFTIMEYKKLTKGCKLTGTCGNKGTISEIVPDDEMPTVCSGPLKGTRAEVCLNPLGIINRMNLSQSFIQEINFIGLFVRHLLKENLEKGKIKTCKKILLKHYELLNPGQREFTVEFFKELDKEETIKFFENLIEFGIPVHQGPFTDNINIYDLAEIYKYYINEYGIEKCEFTKKKAGKTLKLVNKMVIGEIYMMRLKHEASNKNSARSTNLVDLNNLPAKDREFKEYKSLYPKTPIKWGEQEVMNSMLTKDTTAIRELLDSYGISRESEQILENELLTGNPFEVDIKFPKTKSKATKVNDELLYGIGLELELDGEHEEDDSDVIYEEDDVE